MTLRHTLRSLSALCALAALCGCGTAPAPPAPLDTTKFTLENTDRFVALDAAAEAAVSCTGLQERALGDGRLEVVANLKNGGTVPVHVRVQCTFIDGQGMPVAAEAPWQALDIAGDSTEVMRFTAPVLEAKRYVIRVRTAR
jgi:uncharacterized protein YcfL